MTDQDKHRTLTKPSAQGHAQVNFRGFPGSLSPPVDDSLPVLEIKPHTTAKLEALGRYCNAFSTALKQYPTAYLDLYAGPGVARLDHGQLVWGSPLLALQCPQPFQTLVFVEQQADRFDALVQRTERMPGRGETVSILNAASEGSLPDVLARIPRRAMTLTVIDPFRLEFALESVEKLAKAIQALDLIILFADGMDLVRNAVSAINGDPVQARRLDAVFGPSWRSHVKLGPPAAKIAATLRDLYTDRLRAMGLIEIGRTFEVQRDGGGQTLYRLIFASRHPRATQIWNATVRPPTSAQTELFPGLE